MRFAQFGIGHDLEIPGSTQKPTDKDREDLDIEEDLEANNLEPLNSEATQVLADGQAVDCAGTESDTEPEEMDIEDDVSDSDSEEADNNVDSDNTSDVEYVSF